MFGIYLTSNRLECGERYPSYRIIVFQPSAIASTSTIRFSKCIEFVMLQIRFIIRRYGSEPMPNYFYFWFRHMKKNKWIYLHPFTVDIHILARARARSGWIQRGGRLVRGTATQNHFDYSGFWARVFTFTWTDRPGVCRLVGESVSRWVSW